MAVCHPHKIWPMKHSHIAILRTLCKEQLMFLNIYFRSIWQLLRDFNEDKNKHVLFADLFDLEPVHK